MADRNGKYSEVEKLFSEEFEEPSGTAGTGREADARKRRPEASEPSPSVKKKSAPDTGGTSKAKKAKSKKPPENPRSRVATAVFSIILTLAIGVFLFSGIKLISIWLQYKTANDTYKKIDKIFSDEGADEWKWDFSALFAENPEAKGYLHCTDVVSYPIVQTDNNDVYLYTMFNGEYNPAGSLFIDYRIQEGLEARNCVIYGHNMNDGSMFGKLGKFDEYSYYEAHKEFDVYTPEHHYVYKVISAFTTPVDGFIYTYSFADDNDFLRFADSAVSAGSYSTEHAPITPESRLITLSTCTWDGSDEYRYVVVLLRDRTVD